MKCAVILSLFLPLLSQSLVPGQTAGERAGISTQQTGHRIVEGRQGPVARTVEATFAPWMQKEQPPGAIVVVRHDGKSWFFPFGEADQAKHREVTPDTVFELASITKVFTTTSLAMELDAGGMQLDDLVSKYIPELREATGDIRSVTLRQLATHTSSLPRSAEGNPPGGRWTRQSVMKWLAEWQAPYPPGTKSLYSNLAVGLLGYAIADYEHRPLIEVWQQQFLGPLEMKHSFFEPSPDDESLIAQGYGPKGAPVPHDPIGGWPAGGRLSSSGRDMARFLAANLGERSDLPAVTQAMQLAQKPYFRASAKMMQGLAWQRLHIEGEFVIDKNGGLSGTSTYIGMLPERHLGVVVMANRGKCNATAIGRKLLLALAGK
jgi:beta-lactamase class C